VDVLRARFKATIAGSSDLKAGLAGENLASPVIAEDFINVWNALAVLAIGDVTPERRSNGATTTALGVTFNINTVMTASTVGDTTDSLSGSASRVIALPPGETLRATPVREVPTHPITLAVWWPADTIGGICRRGRRVTIPARKVARALDTTEGTCVLRVVAFLLVFLVLDESSEIVMGSIPTDSVDDIPCHRVTVKEPGKDGQTEADVKVSCKNTGTGRSDLDVQIQSGTNIDEAPLHTSLPRLDNLPGRRSICHGGRKEEGE